MTPGELLDMAIAIAGELNVDVDIRARSEYSQVLVRREAILRLRRYVGRETEELTCGFTVQELADARRQDVVGRVHTAVLMMGR